MPYSLYIKYVFLSFWISTYHFLFNFLKCTKSSTNTDTLKKITQNFQNWYLFAVFTNIHVSFSTQEIFRTLYSLFVACAGFCESITKCKECFYFWRSLSNYGFRITGPVAGRHLYRSLLCSAHRSHCLRFSIFVSYFSSVSIF